MFVNALVLTFFAAGTFTGTAPGLSSLPVESALSSPRPASVLSSPRAESASLFPKAVPVSSFRRPASVPVSPAPVPQAPPFAYYQSELIKGVHFSEIRGTYAIRDDKGDEVQVSALKDDAGMLYWYRRIQTPVCLTGECKNVDIGIYWRCTGKFLGLEVYRENLTKTDHTEFTPIDYDQLLSILHNEWSALREYEFTELVEDPGPSAVDGTVGATRQVIASEAVKNAVYTTYTIWHLANAGENEQLGLLTLDLLERNDGLLQKLVNSPEKEYRHFLLEELSAQHLSASPALVPLVMEGLKAADDPYMKSLAFRALPLLPAGDKKIQSGLSDIYRAAPVGEKLQVLSALRGASALDPALYQALTHDLQAENEWFAVKVLEALEHLTPRNDAVLAAAKRLAQSDNSFVSSTAARFLKESE